MVPLTIVAKIKAQPGGESIVRQALLQLVPPTLAEAGCLNYDLHRSIEDPTLFFFYENWDSESSWQKHMNSEHIRAFQSTTADSITIFEVLLMQPGKST